MATVLTKTSFFPHNASLQITSEKGHSNGRTYALIPAAHSGISTTAYCVAVAVLLVIIVLVVGTILGISTSQGNAEMLLAV